MGTSKRWPIAQVLLGSVAETVISKSECPVLSLKPQAGMPLPRAVKSRLSDGTPILIRPVVPEDKELLQQGLSRMSNESRYRRFMTPLRELTDSQLRYLTEIDYQTHMAWGAVEMTGNNSNPLGVARYKRLADDPAVAEAAVTVVDSYQARGLGSLLLGALVGSAAANGVKWFRGYVLENNAPARRLLETFNADVSRDCEGCLRFDVEVPETLEDLPNKPMGKVFRAVAGRKIPPPAVAFIHGEKLVKAASALSRLFE
jgi:GNAT superfamily N-acetyltransferase